MALPALNSTDVLYTPHQDSTSIALETKPTSNSNEGVAEGFVENQERAPPLTKAIGELQSLTNVLQTFHCRWDELQKLVDFIENAIESKEKQLVGPLRSDPPKDSVINMVTNESESASLTIKDTTTSDPPGLQNQESEQKNLECEEKPPTLKTRKTSESELESICRSMGFRELRRYITHHFPQPLKLRKEVPLALLHAPNPAELVLKTVGKFYVQSQKAFFKNPSIISARKAALLVLEYFLLMEHNNRIDESVKEESKQAVLAWKKRLIAEGGLSVAGMQDARGILLLVGCFGIPDKLSNEDLIHILRISNTRDISEALRKSSFLLARVPEIIECMVNGEMTVEALDIVYTLGLEDQFLQKIMSPFLKSLKDACNKAKSEAKGSPAVLKKATEKQLMALKSLRKCFQAHKVDSTKVMPGWKLNEKISTLEKDIAELDKKTVSKRKAEERSSSTVSTTQNSKRPKVGKEPLVPGPVPVPSPVPVPTLAPMPMPVPVPVLSPFSSLQESRVTIQQQAPVPSPFKSFQEPRVNNQPLVQAPPVQAPSPFSSLVDPRAANQQGYQLGSRYSDPVHDHPTPSPWHHGYGTIGISNRGSFVAPSFGAGMSSGSSFRERPVDHNFAGSLSLSEGFRVAPTFGGASQNSSSDLYSFADVIDSDYARNPYKSGEPSGLTSYRPAT